MGLPSTEHLEGLAKRLGVVCARGAREMVVDRQHRTAAQMAFFAALAAVPLLLLVIAVLGWFEGAVQAERHIVEGLFSGLPLPESDRPVITGAVVDVANGTGSLGLGSVVLLLISVSAMTSGARYAINQAYDQDEERSLVRRKLVDVFVVPLAGVLAASAIAANALDEAAGTVEGGAGGLGDLGSLALRGVSELVPFLLGFLIVWLLFRLLPSSKVGWSDSAVGAAVATVLIVALRALMELYFEHLSDYDALYGSLAAVVALLIFSYAAAIAFVYGAEVAAEWYRAGQEDEDQAGDEARQEVDRIKDSA